MHIIQDLNQEMEQEAAENQSSVQTEELENEDMLEDKTQNDSADSVEGTESDSETTK